MDTDRVIRLLQAMDAVLQHRLEGIKARADRESKASGLREALRESGLTVMKILRQECDDNYDISLRWVST